MGKGYISQHEIEFRNQLNKIAAENRYKEMLAETYAMKEQDRAEALSEYDPNEYESSLGLATFDDW